MAIAKKIYAVEIGGKTLFIRAQTTRGAIKGLSAAISREAEKTVRQIDAAALLELIQTQGAPVVIDTAEQDDAAEAANADAAAADAAVQRTDEGASAS
jgi:hypothetical protein